MYTEHYDNGDIRVTFTTAASYWDFLEVAAFTVKPWAVRIFDKGEYHLAAEFPTTRKEYYGIKEGDVSLDNTVRKTAGSTRNGV